MHAKIGIKSTFTEEESVSDSLLPVWIYFPWPLAITFHSLASPAGFFTFWTLSWFINVSFLFQNFHLLAVSWNSVSIIYCHLALTQDPFFWLPPPTVVCRILLSVTLSGMTHFIPFPKPQRTGHYIKHCQLNGKMQNKVILESWDSKIRD